MFANTFKRVALTAAATLLVAGTTSADYYNVRPVGSHYSNSGDRAAGYRSTTVYTAPRFFAPAPVAVAPRVAPPMVAVPTRPAAPAVTVPVTTTSPMVH